MELIHANALCLPAAQLHAGRHDVLYDLCTEAGYVLCVIIRAAHVQIAERCEGFIAHGFCHFMPQVYKLVINLVQLCLVFDKESRPGFKCRLAHGAVRGFHVFEQAIIVADLPVEFNLAACCKRLIFAAEAVFFLHEGNKCGRHPLDAELGVYEHLLPVRLRKLGTEGG